MIPRAAWFLMTCQSSADGRHPESPGWFIFCRLACPLVLAFLVLAVRPCRADEEAQLFGKTIRSIEYRADEPVERSRFDLVIGLKPGEQLTRSGVKNALQALYDTGRFSMIAADAAPEGEGVALRFVLQLNYYFNRFTISGPVDLRGREPWEAMPLPVGERFTRTRLEEARQLVVNYLKEQGFYQAEVKAQTTAYPGKRQVDTNFEVRPGRPAVVRAVEITGVPPFEEKEMRRRLGAEQGKRYDRRRVMRGLDRIRENLTSRGYLSAVADFSESYAPQDNTIAVALKVGNFGKIRVRVEGFKVERSRLRYLLPVLSGVGAETGSLEQGVLNLRSYLEENGYPDAEVEVKEESEKNDIRLVRYLIQPARRITVGYVRFQGNRALSESELQAALQVLPARLGRKTVYSRTNLEDDVQALETLYNSRGYLEARVTPQVTPLAEAAHIGITYVCSEGRLSRTKSVTLTGNRAIPAKTLAAGMQLKQGGPYSPQTAERDRQALLALYNDAGFLQARVACDAGKPDAGGNYAVEFRIEESVQSRIDEVIVLGNRHTRESLIEKKIRLHPNDPLSLGKMLETQQALYNIGIFDRVRVSPQNPDSVTPYQNVVVRLDEAQRFTIRYGFGYQEWEKLRGTVELSDLNIFGIGQRADLLLRGSGIERLASLNLQQPQFRFLPVNSYLNLSAQQKREISYDVKRFNVAYQYSHELNSHSWGLLRYSYQKVRVFNSQVEPQREDTPRTLSTVSAIYINDTRDNYLDPEKGFFSSTDLSITTKLLGSNSYWSLFTQNSYYRKLRGSLSAAASIRFGFAIPYGGDTDLPISERFFAGGASSLRGFEIDSAGPLDPKTFAPTGGNSIFVGNLELRTPSWHSVLLAGFYDTGNVFSSLGSFDVSQFSHTVGAGIRVKTPFGPLRADYGFNLNLPALQRAHGFKSGHFFITIGPPF